MTKKIELNELPVEAETKPVEPVVVTAEVPVPEPVEEPVLAAPEAPVDIVAVEPDVAYPVPEDDREYGENELLDQSGLFTEFEQAEEHVFQPDLVNLANSRTLPWESDPYGLLSMFREYAIEAAQNVSGKDEYVKKFKADLYLLEQHIDALHEREKNERLKLVEEQAKRDEEAKQAYRSAQENRLAELRKEAALIKQELESDE